MKKYAIYPGWVQSKTDGQWHYISASKLMQLYQVLPSECVIVDEKYPETYKGYDLSKLISLEPLYSGDYKK